MMRVRELIEKLKDMPPESEVLQPRYDGVGGEEWTATGDLSIMRARCYSQQWGEWSVDPDGQIVVTIS